MRSSCPQHCQPVDEQLHSCWKCVAQERDPASVVVSWWWHLEPATPEPTQVDEVHLWLKKVA